MIDSSRKLHLYTTTIVIKINIVLMVSRMKLSTLLSAENLTRQSCLFTRVLLTENLHLFLVCVNQDTFAKKKKNGTFRNSLLAALS